MTNHVLQTHVCAKFCAVEPNSCVLEIMSGYIEPGRHYSFQGIGLPFLAGKVMWVRGRKAGMFFKYGLHRTAVQHVKDRRDAAEENGSDRDFPVRLELLGKS